MSRPRRVAIIGAGLGGLAAACALADYGFVGEVVIIDAKTGFRNDRTWCWWDVPGVPFRDEVSHRWHAWSVGTEGCGAVSRSAQHPYIHLSGERYYRLARHKIEQSLDVRWQWNTSVTGIVDRGDSVLVRSSEAIMSVDIAIDARGQLPFSSPLVQYFVGEHIRADRPVFQPDTVRLMDFRYDAHGLAFTYVLPYSTTEALVEDTLIGNSVDFPARRAALSAYLARRHGLERWEVVRGESGVIAMNARAVPSRPSPRVFLAGAAAGATRAATGYTYVRAHRHADRLARAIIDGEPLRSPGKWRYRALDALLIAALRHRAIDGVRFFTSLFHATPADALARFMSDASTLADEAAVITGAASAFAAASMLDPHARRQVAGLTIAPA